MTGDLFINDTDAYTTYGVYVADGGYSGVVQYPSLKSSFPYNDWPDEDGIEVDLSSPQLDTKTFKIDFHSASGAALFIEEIQSEPYHEFNFERLGIIRTLRLTSEQSLRSVRNAESFSLEFADDFPLKDYSYVAPVPTITQTGYEIDETSLSAYGVFVSEGTDDELKIIPPVKPNLSVNESIINGMIYDNSTVVFKQRDVKVKCHMRATTTTFWRNYNALLYDLTRPGTRLFSVDKLSKTFPCYYKSASVTSFHLVRGEVWCDFTITLVFLGRGNDYATVNN
jgi:hypothetical protein